MANDIPAVLGGRPLFADLDHRSWPIVTDNEQAAVRAVLDRGILSGSFAPEAVALEQEFARFVGARHCLLTHCGTSALQLALSCAGVGAGDEVIVPAYSFVATPMSVVLQGAIPIFVDVELENGTIDADALGAAIGPRTRAIMPVHMHGCAADVAPIVAIAAKHDLAVVEDAAQAHGARYRDRPVGALGCAGGFSLQSSKNLSAGEGGLFVTNDASLAEEANRVRNFGQDLRLADVAGFNPRLPLDGDRALDSRRVGSMYRGNEMMAAFARAQLRQLPERTERCRQHAERLSKLLGALPGVHPPVTPPDRTSVHHKYRVRLDPEAAGVALSALQLRDAMARALRAEGVEVVLWQTVPLPAQTVFQKRIGFGRGFPWSEDGSDRVVANYDPRRYPVTQRLLDGSIVLFSQSHPLIAQDDRVVDRYAEAFARVWQHRVTIADQALREASSITTAS